MATRKSTSRTPNASGETKTVSKPRTRKPAPGGAATLLDAYRRHLQYTQCKPAGAETPYDQYVALALAAREQLVDRMNATLAGYSSAGCKEVDYLSLEYLLGRQLRNNLSALDLLDDARDRLAADGVDIADLFEMEPDPGLGNGGLGRLAACYLDSLAALGYPAYGYGLRYEFGIFNQEIEDGWQVERPDYWLRFGSPWEIVRPDLSVPVRIYGYVEDRYDAEKRYRPTWRGYKTVIGVPYDVPVAASGSGNVNVARFWSARAPDYFDLSAFNRGGYVEAVRDRALTETITKVLYPSDEIEAGKQLRLTQQYFFVACTIADILRRFDETQLPLAALASRVAIQLNDTHPALAVAELMRVLIDERGLGWDEAWAIVAAVFGYTNHTLLPEALETWRVSLFSGILPRHIQIIYEINTRFLETVRKRWPGDAGRVERLSLIQETPSRAVRMANLSIVASRKVNGVAALHSRLVRTRLAPDFAELWPEKFENVTNGITHRRWLIGCNPELASAITRRIGAEWMAQPARLRTLEPFADDPEFQREFMAIRRANKERFGAWIGRRLGVRVSPDALFDVHVKRIHEYKRQLLNALRLIAEYRRLSETPRAEAAPRVVLIGGKAAPAYHRAKLIIRLVHAIAEKINSDPVVGGRLMVIFVPNYSVSVAEKIIPAADLSEQISLAGTEASGTGNMKFAMNGALTIGTLDGANIEIRDCVGSENFFHFGLTEEQVVERRPSYDPWHLYLSDERTRGVVDMLQSGLSNGSGELFKPLFDALTHEGDRYMNLADLPEYLAAQSRVDALWADPAAWARAAILNIARVGHFSSDRSVAEYAERIWGIKPVRCDEVAEALDRTNRKTGRGLKKLAE